MVDYVIPGLRGRIVDQQRKQHRRERHQARDELQARRSTGTHRHPPDVLAIRAGTNSVPTLLGIEVTVKSIVDRAEHQPGIGAI